MKRYLVFAGWAYSECPWGWNGFEGAFETEAEATAHAQELVRYNDWAQVVDLQALEKVHEVCRKD